MNSQISKRLRKAAKKGKRYTYEQLKRLYKTGHKEIILQLLNEYDEEIKELKQSSKGVVQKK